MASLQAVCFRAVCFRSGYLNIRPGA